MAEFLNQTTDRPAIIRLLDRGCLERLYDQLHAHLIQYPRHTGTIQHRGHERLSLPNLYSICSRGQRIFFQLSLLIQSDCILPDSNDCVALDKFHKTFKITDYRDSKPTEKSIACEQAAVFDAWYFDHPSSFCSELSCSESFQ